MKFILFLVKLAGPFGVIRFAFLLFLQLFELLVQPSNEQLLGKFAQVKSLGEGFCDGSWVISFSYDEAFRSKKTQI